MTLSVIAEQSVLHCVDPACLDRVHASLDQLWSAAPLVAVRDRELFATAVIEIAGNILAHTGSAFECRITLTVCDESLVAVLEDTGDAVEVDLEAVGWPDELAESGRGLAIARAAVDEVSYRRAGDHNVWRIRRAREG